MMKAETLRALEPEAKRLKILLADYGLEIVAITNQFGMAPELVLAMALIEDQARRIKARAWRNVANRTHAKK